MKKLERSDARSMSPLVIRDMAGKPVLRLVAPGLTTRQQNILLMINLNPNSSIRGLQKMYGDCSPNGMLGFINALEKKGWISREARKGRTLRLAKQLIWEEIAS